MDEQREPRQDVPPLSPINEHTSLHEIEAVKAELLATVSHEFRSPLASIKGYTATLLRHEQHISAEERHEFLLAIDHASTHLSTIVERLLEMSQLDSGSIQLEYTSVNLLQLVQNAIDAAEAHIQEMLSKRKEGPLFTFLLRLEDEYGQPITTLPNVIADKRRLREVLDHLLENALLYSPDGGRITIKIRPILVPNLPIRPNLSEKENTEVPAAQQTIEICITDSGVGIPPEHITAIFNRFHRVDMRLIRSANGLGLGLTVSKQLIELHQGLIWAESTLNQGSSFYFRLPLDARTHP